MLNFLAKKTLAALPTARLQSGVARFGFYCASPLPPGCLSRRIAGHPKRVGMPRSSLLLLAASALAAPADDGSSARCTLPDGCPPVNGSQWVGVVSSGSLGPVPSLLLIGTRKGGTTSLSKQLLLHPHVLAPNCAYDRSEWPVRAARTTCVWDKEVRYFSRGVGVGLDFCWYRRRYPCASPPHVTFDGSPDRLALARCLSL